MDQVYTTARRYSTAKTRTSVKEKNISPTSAKATARRARRSLLPLVLLLWAQFMGAHNTASAQGSWEPRSSTTTNTIWSTAYGNGKFVAVGTNGSVLNSTNGVTWSHQTLAGIPELEDVVYTGSQWVAVGDGGVVYTSPNGITWMPRSSGTTVNLYGVASNGTQIVAVGVGTVIRSVDGVSWTRTTLSGSLMSVEYSNGLFILVGENGNLYTSADGITWTPRASGTTTNALYRVAYGNNQFVVVGQVGLAYTTGYVITSPDGINWTPRTLPAGTGVLTGVAYTNGKFVAVGWGGAALFSTDGITWVRETTGTTSNFFDVAWGGGRFAAVGELGMIRTQNYPNATLPVAGLQFSAVQKETTVALQWSTATEQQAAAFVIQHSTDGRQWQNLGTVAAAGNSDREQAYSFVHNNPAAGSNQYRLLQRDADGKQQYSQVVSVNVRVAAAFTIRQNPVHHVLPLQFTDAVPEGALLQLTDMSGRVVREHRMAKTGTACQLDVSGLAPGQYLAVMITPNGKEAKAFIKQ